MTQAFDFSEAALISAPEAVRDGGSVCLVLRIEGTDCNLRYAGGLARSVRPQGIRQSVLNAFGPPVAKPQSFGQRDFINRSVSCAAARLTCNF